MIGRKSLASALFVLALPAMLWAQGTTAWVSVPSTPNSSDRVVIRGGNLVPLSTVTISVQELAGARSDQLAVVGPDGTLAVEYLPPVPGGYTVRVTDQQGVALGGGSFGYAK